jgi:hypothetical protein
VIIIIPQLAYPINSQELADLLNYIFELAGQLLQFLILPVKPKYVKAILANVTIGTRIYPV